MITQVYEACHLIDGAWSDEGDAFESHATTDGGLLCRAPAADASTVDRAVAAARRAFDQSDWKDRRAADRATVLLELGARLDAQAEEISQLVAREISNDATRAMLAEAFSAP